MTSWQTTLYRTFHKLVLIFALVLTSQVPSVSLADSISEYTIKAAFIYNFVRFTQWPDNSNEIRVCIYGEDPFESNIDNLNGKVSNGRVMRVIRTQLIDDIKSCHIAFLNIIPPERHLFERALKTISGSNVLTVSDAANVINFGVMIGLFIDNDKVAFELNHTAAKISGLEISAQLIRLAKDII